MYVGIIFWLLLCSPLLSLSHSEGVITLAHSKDNQICDSSYDTTRTWNGLSPFGREVVREMNRRGIMVDISHVSDSAFFQVLEITRVPVIASHSSCRVFTPGSRTFPNTPTSSTNC